MTVASSLRYLCLKKVISDEIKNYEVLPTVLVRDINLMKMFNGSYVNRSHPFSSFPRTHYLRIFYDGENWNLKSFMCYVRNCYCSSCRDLDEVFDTTIREGQIIPAGSQIHDFFSEVIGQIIPAGFEIQDVTELFEFDMKFEVEESQDGTFALVFHSVGNGGIPGTSFSSRFIKSIDGTLVLHIPTDVFRKDQFIFTGEEAYWPTNGM